MRNTATAICLIVGVSVSVSFFTQSLAGTGPRACQLVLDFRKPDAIKSLIKWNPTNKVEVTDAGFGTKVVDQAQGSVDCSIETTKLIGIGESWCPAQRATIHVYESWAHGRKPSGLAELYVSYSCDGLHWSDWHAFTARHYATDSTTRLDCVLQIPNRERTEYESYFRRYSNMKVPWPGDQEAAVRWILKQDSGFFEKSRPFIGYVRFLYEIRIDQTQRLERLDFDIYYTGGGFIVPDHGKLVKGRNGPWRLRENTETAQGQIQVEPDPVERLLMKDEPTIKH